MVSVYRNRSTKTIIFVLVCICAFILYCSNMYMVPTYPAFSKLDKTDWSNKLHLATIENYFRKRQVSTDTQKF